MRLTRFYTPKFGSISNSPPQLISAVKWHIIMLMCFIFDKSTLKLCRYSDGQAKSWHASKLRSFKAKLKTKTRHKKTKFPQMFNHFKMEITSLDVWLYPAGNYENCSKHLRLALFWGKITRNTTWISEIQLEFPQHTISMKRMNLKFSLVSSLTTKVKIIHLQQDAEYSKTNCRYWDEGTYAIFDHIILCRF